MFLVPAFLAIYREGKFKNQDNYIWYGLWFVFTILIGLRVDVGGDYNNYLDIYNAAAGSDLLDAIEISRDIAYGLLNWISGKLGLGLYGVNLVSGAIFMTGLMVFQRREKEPWMAFAVAVPYIVIVVAMGYTRQSVALGFIFLALSSLELGKFKSFMIYSLFAVLFHKTAIVVIPLGLFMQANEKGGRYSSYIRVGSVFILLYGVYVLVFEQYQESFEESYIESKMESAGAAIRVAMNVFPSLLLLFYRKRWMRLFPRGKLWIWLSLISLACIPALSIGSTAIDRLALYLTPLQVAVYSRLPRLARRDFSPFIIRMSVLIGYAGVLYVWLVYAKHAEYWVPYHNALYSMFELN